MGAKPGLNRSPAAARLREGIPAQLSPALSRVQAFVQSFEGSNRNKKRGGHPGHDQGRRLSIPQVAAPQISLKLALSDSRMNRCINCIRPIEALHTRLSGGHSVGPAWLVKDSAQAWLEKREIAGENRTSKKYFFDAALRPLQARPFAARSRPRNHSCHGAPPGAQLHLHAGKEFELSGDRVCCGHPQKRVSSCHLRSMPRAKAIRMQSRPGVFPPLSPGGLTNSSQTLSGIFRARTATRQKMRREEAGMASQTRIGASPARH